jgi:hypothetical protein
MSVQVGNDLHHDFTFISRFQDVKNGGNATGEMSVYDASPHSLDSSRS